MTEVACHKICKVKKYVNKPNIPAPEPRVSRCGNMLRCAPEEFMTMRQERWVERWQRMAQKEGHTDAVKNMWNNGFKRTLKSETQSQTKKFASSETLPVEPGAIKCGPTEARQDLVALQEEVASSVA